jgi:hypothetical protein
MKCTGCDSVLSDPVNLGVERCSWFAQAHQSCDGEIEALVLNDETGEWKWIEPIRVRREAP